MCSALARPHPCQPEGQAADSAGRQLRPGAIPAADAEAGARRSRSAFRTARPGIFPPAASFVAKWYLDAAQSLVRERRPAGAARRRAQGPIGREGAMRAAIFRGGDLVVDTLPAPVPAQGQVLVKTLACGICGSDLHAAKHAHRMVEVTKRIPGRTPMDL